MDNARRIPSVIVRLGSAVELRNTRRLLPGSSIERGMAVWTHRCSHQNKDDSQCKRKSTVAVWAFMHADWHFGQATWDEYCGWHVTDAKSIVTQMPI